MDKNEDYYSILGVDKSATQSDIKKAYRKLAVKHHPDKGGDEAEFKRISNAFSILSDDEKRRQYDQFGAVGNQPNMNMNDIFSNFGDIFGDIFGNTNPFAHQQSQNVGSAIKIKMTLTYLDVLNGVNKKIKLNRKHVCSTCNGTGGEETENCTNCKGSGKQINVQNTVLGQIRQVSKCTYCNGFGYSIKITCLDCEGTGYIPKEEIIDIEIPSGVESGMQLRQRGSGNYVRNGIPGDLVIELIVEDMFGFDRSNNNLYSSLVISIPDAILGCLKTVKTIDDKDLSIKIEPGMQSGKTYRFNNEGLPDINYKVRGDLIYTVVVNIPKEISEEERKVIENLRNFKNFKI